MNFEIDTFKVFTETSEEVGGLDPHSYTFFENMENVPYWIQDRLDVNWLYGDKIERPNEGESVEGYTVVYDKEDKEIIRVIHPNGDIIE
mgnify:CR=1 FL=1